jgi:hypothetical protein
MSDIHIVCLQEVAGPAGTLGRLLAAEQHSVRLSVGREALWALEGPRCEQDIVLVIWSPETAHQLHIAEWAARTGPDRLVEITMHVQHPPRVPRREQPIDFTQWRGERGGRAWNALGDRLRAAARTMEPAKAPPKQAAFAMAAMGAMAVGGALALRLHAPDPTMTTSFETDRPIEAQTGVGGAIDISEVVEPPSVDEVFGAARLPRRLSAMPRAHYEPLVSLTEYEEPEIRDPTLLERISAFNPLRGRRSDND